MGTPNHKTSERYIQLGRAILRAMRQNPNDQWIDIHQIINGPKLFEFPGGVTRGEIDTSATYINRKNATDTPKIETKANEDTSVEYNKSNSANCKRRKPERCDCPIQPIPQHDETRPSIAEEERGARWRCYAEIPPHPAKTTSIFPTKQN